MVDFLPFDKQKQQAISNLPTPKANMGCLFWYKKSFLKFFQWSFLRWFTYIKAEVNFCSTVTVCIRVYWRGTGRNRHLFQWTYVLSVLSLKGQTPSVQPLYVSDKIIFNYVFVALWIMKLTKVVCISICPDSWSHIGIKNLEILRYFHLGRTMKTFLMTSWGHK